ncbi:MAG: GTP cyclohydrolase I, partial [Saprospiraceae bacterium]
MPKNKQDERDAQESISIMQKHYEGLLLQIGEDVNRNGLIKTPERAAKALHYLTNGYNIEPSAILMSAMFEEEYSEMV